MSCLCCNASIHSLISNVLQEEDDAFAGAENFSLDSPAVELFLSPAVSANSSPQILETCSLLNDTDMSRDDDGPLDGDTNVKETPSSSRRRKKKGAKQHRKSGGGGAM